MTSGKYVATCFLSKGFLTLSAFFIIEISSDSEPSEKLKQFFSNINPVIYEQGRLQVYPEITLSWLY